MSLRPPIRHWLVPCAAFVAVSLLAGVFTYSFLDAGPSGLYRHSIDPRFYFAGIAGAAAFAVTRFWMVGRSKPRRSLVMAHRALALQVDGYREARALTVDDLLARLRGLGYRPAIAACADDGTVRGPAPAAMPLAGTHVRISDERLSGYLRLHLPATERAPGEHRLSLLEIVAEPSSAMEEMGLFALRELDGILGGVRVTPTDSALSAVEARTFTAGLTERPTLA